MTGMAPVDSTAAPADISCRLCDGTAKFAFNSVLIGKYRVAFFRCRDCESLQSENPYWLPEAYSDAVLSIDPGAAQRVLDCVGLTDMVMRLFRCRTTLDYGGGAGLLSRLLRDAGRDAYWYDGYTPPSYATGFSGSLEAHYDLMTAFEVIEHFANPKSDLDALFRTTPEVVLIMTYLYQGQDSRWWYIAPEEGQHIFFYSPTAIKLIAQRYGYHPLICNGFVVFSRSAPTPWQKMVLRRILTPKIVSWLKLVVLARRTDAPQRDSALLEARVRQNQKTIP